MAQQVDQWNQAVRGVEGVANGVALPVSGTVALQSGTANIGHVYVDSPLPAGANIIGLVGIDQTTPGTTNGVQINAPVPSGTNIIGKVDIASSIPAGSAIIGVVGIDQTTPGTTNGVAVNQALPSGTYNIGHVDVDSHPAGVLAGMATLPAGTNNIGDVDLASSLPSGTNIIGKVDIASSLPAGSAIIGVVGFDQTTPGTTNAVQTRNVFTGVSGSSVTLQPSASTLITDSNPNRRQLVLTHTVLTGTARFWINLGAAAVAYAGLGPLVNAGDSWALTDIWGQYTGPVYAIQDGAAAALLAVFEAWT